jgi:hypothetical protein
MQVTLHDLEVWSFSRKEMCERLCRWDNNLWDAHETFNRIAEEMLVQLARAEAETRGEV